MQVKQDYLYEIKRILNRNTLLTYLDFNEYLISTLMLARSNWERLSARKANLSLSTVGKLLIPNNDIQ